MVLVASISSDVVARCGQGLQDTCMVVALADAGALTRILAHAKPLVVFLDVELPGFAGHNGIVAFLRRHRDQKIVVLGNALSDDMELELVKAGARGCCRRDMDASLYISIFKAVQQDELWMRRVLMSRLLDEISTPLPVDMKDTRTAIIKAFLAAFFFANTA
jgi:DNA-binding NarL/FixJ family response regulator